LTINNPAQKHQDMAYQPNHDPYYTNNSVPYAGSDYDHPSNWDSKSYQSSYTGSQARLNPHYEKSQVPAIPPLPYPQSNYPPARPVMLREQGSGYSMARDNLMKRRSIRQVELFQGNLVLDVPVPSHIIPKHLGDMEEMRKMRYTAATCDPDDFMRSRYSLRQAMYGRQTELFIVMTMYNEDEVLFVKTMNAYVTSAPALKRIPV
jgi:chitin synthase